MGFMGISNILMVTGIIFILYFSYNAAKEDGTTNIGEFFKLAGILALLAIFLSVFIGVTFLFIQGLSWILIYLLSVLKNEVFSMKVGCVFSLVLINAGGAYMLWEQIKEKREEKKFKDEPASTYTPPSEPYVKGEETSQEDKAVSEKPDDINEDKKPVTEEAKEDSNDEKPEEESEHELSKKTGISNRISKILIEGGIDTVEKLTSTTETVLRDTKNIGEKSIEEIKTALEANDLSLKEE